MRFNHFDMNLLVVLDALLTERNITRAGEKVFLSQSATSGALSRLRDYFEDPLLTQAGRKMMLTPLGESLIVPVRESLMKVQTTLDSRPDSNIFDSNRHLKLVMSDGSFTVLMPEVLRKASILAPNVTVEMFSPENDPVDELVQGNVDFLLLPSQFLEKSHPTAELFEEDFVVVCWQDHDVLNNSITMEQYQEVGHVLVRFGSKRRPSIDIWMTERTGIERRVEVTVNTFSEIPHCLVGTQRKYYSSTFSRNMG